VVFDQQGTFVWRVRDELGERVPIDIGLRKNGRVEVKLGLSPGDTIVSAGTHKVIPGRKLRAAEVVETEEVGSAPRSTAPGGSGT
jgi:hypothetical protein